LVELGAFITPPVTQQQKAKRSSAKQDSFKKKLVRRNKSDRCDICTENAGGVLEGAHVIPHAHKERLENEYDEDRANLPISVNDAMNGLLLCPTCHAYYDLPVGNKSKIRNIHILANGTIRLNGIAKQQHYKNLNGKKVPWKLGESDYPTAQLLEFALSLPTVKGKRTSEVLDEEGEEGGAEIKTLLFSSDSNSDENDFANKKNASKRRRVANKKDVQEKQSSKAKGKKVPSENELLRYGLSYQEIGVYSSSKIV
jgi:hypothetical protein